MRHGYERHECGNRGRHNAGHKLAKIMAIARGRLSPWRDIQRRGQLARRLGLLPPSQVVLAAKVLLSLSLKERALTLIDGLARVVRKRAQKPGVQSARP